MSIIPFASLLIPLLLVSVSSCRQNSTTDLRIRVPNEEVTFQGPVQRARITEDVKSFNYVGNVCELKKGEEFTFLDLSSDRGDYTSFRLAQPIEGCSEQQFLTILTRSVELIEDGQEEEGSSTPHKPDRDFYPQTESPPEKIAVDDLPPPTIPNPKTSPPPVSTSPRKFFFPLHRKVRYSYISHGRSFGALRNWGRRHAGADLIADPGTPVRAVADGEMLQFYVFYQGTYALEVDHYDFVVRYGEVRYRQVDLGSKVKAGQVIADVGLLRDSGNSMLHFEMYKGTLSGPLTQGSVHPYQRRRDLVNPTKFLQSLERGVR